MAKTILLTMKVTPKEKRALKRFAVTHPKGTVAGLIRDRVINPALSFDPKQQTLQLDERATK